jgi:pyridoxal phosphate enzyme (YggS family)
MGDDALKARIERIQTQINQAAAFAGRSPQDVNLLAVTKGQSIAKIQQAYDLGLRNFGESYWQEAAPKMAALALPIQWHFIGKIQTNKIKHIARHFDWVHSVSREIELSMLSQHRPPTCPPLQICLEVHVPGALGKNGVSETGLAALAHHALQFPNLKLRGLMVMLDPALQQDEQQPVFAQVHALLDQLNQAGFACDALSMGMSNDFTAAIHAGSTWVRIGQALFAPWDILV